MRRDGFDVQFVLMPYPTPSHYLKGESGLKYGSPEEKNNLLIAAWADALREIRAHPRYDPKAHRDATKSRQDAERQALLNAPPGSPPPGGINTSHGVVYDPELAELIALEDEERRQDGQ